MRHLLCLISCTLLTHAAAAQSRELVVLPASTLTIHGKTNVNRFTCAVARYVGRDTLVYAGGEGGGIAFALGRIDVGGRAFDCGNVMMTADFRHTLRVKEHPTVRIELKRLLGWPDRHTPCDSLAVATELEITVAGHSRLAQMVCQVQRIGPSLVRLRGQRLFRFQDFGLTPPQRLFGAVRVADDIDVAFDLHLSEVH